MKFGQRITGSGIAVCVGVAVAFAAGGARAATGDKLVLGHLNTAGQVTTLHNSVSGAALKLVAPNATTPALAVNNKAKVANLNADELDGLDSASFQRVATGSLVLAPDAAAPQNDLLTIGGLGKLTVSCSTTDANVFFLRNPSIPEVDIASERIYDPAGGGAGDAVDTIATFAVTGSQQQFAAAGGVGSKARYTLQFTTPAPGARVYAATVTLTSQDDNIGTGKCLAWAQLD
jgi:hypothetical protein